MDTNDIKPGLPIVIDEVKARDLPKEWAERAKLDPDDVVSVTIGVTRREALRRLGPIMDRLAQSAAAKGLTPEKLREIIPDFPIELVRD